MSSDGLPFKFIRRAFKKSLESHIENFRNYKLQQITFGVDEDGLVAAFYLDMDLNQIRELMRRRGDVIRTLINASSTQRKLHLTDFQLVRNESNCVLLECEVMPAFQMTYERPSPASMIAAQPGDPYSRQPEYHRIIHKRTDPRSC